MKRESSPSIEAEIKEDEEALLAKGATKRQARAIPLFFLYAAAEAKHVGSGPTESELFQHLKNIVGAVLDEIGDPHQAESLQKLDQLDELAPILAHTFDMRQPANTLEMFRQMCASPHKSS